MKPEVLEIVVMNFFGKARTITARVSYGGEVLTLAFSGRQDGAPGHVTLDVEGIRVPVPFPQRFGKRFDKEWVETYFEKEARDT